MTFPSRETVARSGLVVVWLWLATSSFSDVGEAIVSRHLTGHAILGGLSTHVPIRPAAIVVGGLQLVAAVLLALPSRLRRVRYLGGGLSAGLAVGSLSLLLTNPVWMESLGGFPAIGSGQGLLKYAAIVGLSVFLMGVDSGRTRLRDRGLSLSVAGLLLPLVWIGAMKFTLPEAHGIEGLLASSPFFSWMTGVFSTRGASEVIGITELVTAALLATYWIRPAWAAVGGALGVGTFLATLSFLVTAPGWHSELGFPLLSGTGVFLVKDVPLLAVSSMVGLRWWEQRRPGGG